jgi:N-acetylmuramoyl-L-alanine amidase
MRKSWLRVTAAVGGVGLISSVAAGLPGAAVSQGENAAPAVDCSGVDGPAGGRQGDFAQAASAAGVPTAVLLGVSYMESRWDDHAGAPSTSGGYGPMHLTDVRADLVDGRGDGIERQPLESLQTARLASDLTDVPVRRLRTDPAANICGGAALLAHFQDRIGRPLGVATDPSSWADAVARYSGAADARDASRFVRQVYATVRSGAIRTTNDGERVRLAAHPRVRPAALTKAAANDVEVDCPEGLGCEWLPAPYEWYGAPDPGAYGNHDLADRPNDLSIDYIVIHDTETDWQTTLDLVTDPTYVSWQYTLRSSDGHIWQHLLPRDVGWQAGNWYVNAHSIGLEHEGIAAEGAAWYTEAMYQTSAALVRHLTDEYDIPRDRAHVIGHDQVPSITPANVAGMHWDPGPYWDWEHYMRLLHAPIAVRPGQIQAGDTVAVRPGFAGNQQRVIGCERPRKPCERQGTNFVYLHTEPSAASPLVNDLGLHPDGSPGTRQVWDISARAAAGHEFVVAQRRGAWLGVWYLGEIAWLRSPAADPTAYKVRGESVHVVPNADEVPVYGRAYPEEAAYPPGVPYQPIAPLQYTMKAGQTYVLGDDTVPTDYYRATTFDGSSPGDWTVISGDDTYYQVWFGHRHFYVRAADVELVEP